MRAGSLKYTLQLMKPERKTSLSGEETTSYVAVRNVAAERLKIYGSRSEEVSEHFSSYSARFIIRDAHQVEEDWRVKQMGGYLYKVLAVEPNVDRGFKILVCERVNE